MIVDYNKYERQTAPVMPEPITTTIDTSKVVGDFLKTENSLVSTIDMSIDKLSEPKWTVDPSYIPEEDMSGYEEYASDLLGARNRDEMSYIKQRIDKEKVAKESFALASGWQKAVAVGALIATDPINLIPIGGAAIKAMQAGKILKGATMVAGTAAATESMNEAILQSNQYTRTAEESVYNVAGATVLSGLLGGALSSLNKADEARMISNLEEELNTYPTDQSLSTAGAMQVGDTFEELEIKGLNRAKKIMSNTPDFLTNPVWRTATSQSRKVRELSEQLADLSLIREKNTAFKATEASIETKVKAYHDYSVVYFDAEKKLYNDYLKRFKSGDVSEAERIGSHKDGMLTRQEFNEQTWWAGIHNDTHAIPEVQELAKTARSKIYDPILKRAGESGLMDNVDELDVKTAESWMKRMFDTNKIKSNRIEFKQIVMDDLRIKQQNFINSISGIKKEIESTKNEIKINRTNLNLATKSAFNVSFEETFKAIKKDLEDTLTIDDLNNIKKPSTNRTPDIKGRINKGVEDALNSIFKDRFDEFYNSINKEVISDITEIKNITDDLGLDISDFIKEVSPEIGFKIGNEGIDIEAIRKEIANIVIEKVSKINESKNGKAKAKVELSEEELQSLLEGKLAKFINKEANMAARLSAEKAMKEIRAPIKDALDTLKKKLGEKKVELKKAEFNESLSEVELNQIAEELIDRITNETGGRLQYSMQMESSRGTTKAKVGRRGSAKARVWDIADEKIADYLVKDGRAILMSHLRTMGPDIELMNKFGTLDFDVIKKQIQEDYLILQNKKGLTNKDLAKLSKAKKDDIADAQAMWEKIRGIYAQPDDYSSPAETLQRTAMAFNYVRLLGDVVASSIPDLGRHVMVHGFERVYGGLVNGLIKDTKGFKLAKEEMHEISLALDITNSMTALQRVGDLYAPVSGKLDEVLNKTSNAFSLATGINHWNAAQKTFAGILTQNRMLDAIELYAKTGKLPQKEIENLASHGIGREQAIKIAEQYKKYGEKREGAIRIANARNWDNDEIRNIFRNAIRKQVDEIIVTPSLDKPLWLSRGGWRLLGQFRSYTFSSTQRVLLAGLQQADANTLAGVSTMITLGMMTYAWKKKMAGEKTSDDARVWIAEGIDRSGVTGIFMDVNNMVEKATRGTIGINSLLGGHQMSRYASRNVTSALLGPSLGLAQDMFQITGAVATGDFRQSDLHSLRKILPAQNLVYTRWLFDEAEKGITSTFGLKK